MPLSLYNTKHYQLTLKIRKVISGMKPGDRLPIMEELMERFGYSHGTVALALKELTNEGLISRAWGKKFYTITKNRAQELVHLRFVRPEFPHPEADTMFSELCAYGSGCGWHFSYTRFRDIKGLDFKELAKGMDAIILWPTSEILTPEILRFFRRPKCPVLTVIEHIQDERIINLHCDDFEVGRLGAVTLAAKGHQRIAFLKDQPLESTMVERLNGFKKGLEESGLDWDESLYLDTRLVSFGDPLTASYEYLSKLFDAKEPDFTAIFVASEVGSKAVMRICHERGIRIPQDLALLSFSSSTENPLYMNPQLSTIECPYSNYQHKIVEILTQIFEGKAFEHKHFILSPQLVTRETY